MSMKSWISDHPDMFAIAILLIVIAILATIAIVKAIMEANSNKDNTTPSTDPEPTQRVPTLMEQPRYRYASILSNGTASMGANGVNGAGDRGRISHIKG